jgi:hypothetical protein
VTAADTGIPFTPVPGQLLLPLSPTSEGSTVTDTPPPIYVASSWRNPMQDAVVAVLQAAGLPVYDFKNPEPATGFHWSEVDLRQDQHPYGLVDQGTYLRALEHPRAVQGYDSDFAAMQAADTFVLVLPCGRSAHLELGWAVGAGKRTAILLDDPCTPELMYRMVDHLATSVVDLLGWLGVQD